MDTSSSAPSGSLAREAIGLREVLFQSITHMAPAAAVAFSIPFGISYGGGVFEGPHFQRVIKPGHSLFFNGFMDSLYLYPSELGEFGQLPENDR